MLYNCEPRTFDLTDVTGVMNICDRHASICNSVSLSTLLCVCASGLAHSRSLPHLYAITSTVRAHRPCTIVPADYARLHQSGNSQEVHLIHLVNASTRQVVSELIVQIVQVERDDWIEWTNRLQ